MFWILSIVSVVLLVLFYKFQKEEGLPSWIKSSLILLLIVGFFGIQFEEIFFYAEPGYIYHVRTITGEEVVVDSVGYHSKLYGNVDRWKKAMTVVADKFTKDGVDSQSTSGQASASIDPVNIMFLDQVDADAYAMVRFRIPVKEKDFLKMAHEYRNPDNLLKTSLIPAFLETIQANASLMTAEAYYSGGRTEFISEFEDQLLNGIYVVQRKEVSITSIKKQISDANATQPKEQREFGNNQKTVFVVQKLKDKNGIILRKKQQFKQFGISIVESRVTDMIPNKEYQNEMKLKQKASADRAIAREQKVQEEEQKLLVIAKGDRLVAEKQAIMKVEQITVTTKAETARMKAIIDAVRIKEEARIMKEAASIMLEKAKIDANAIKVTADATAYKKNKILKADNALKQKIKAEIEIQKLWANAFSKRKVPNIVFGNGNSNTPTGSDTSVKNFMNMMTLEAAKNLQYDRGLTSAKKGR